MKIGVCKTCAKKHNCKTAQNVAKLIETDMVDIFISPAFQKHIVFFCWMKQKNCWFNSHFVAKCVQNVCKYYRLLFSWLSAFLKAIDH